MERTPRADDGIPTTLVFAETVPLESASAADEGASERGVLSTLSGSLKHDLRRFIDSAVHADLLPVIQAALAMLKAP